MARYKTRFLSIVAALVLLLTTVAPANLNQWSVAQSYAQGVSRTFPETGKTVTGKFLEYWNAHGGLAQQGLPISDARPEVSDTDGNTYLTQYFERARFEFHPENAGTQYEVLLGLLGRELSGIR